MPKKKLECPSCGAEMNNHAEKVSYETVEGYRPDPDFGGIVEDVYTCPGCGGIEMRPAE